MRKRDFKPGKEIDMPESAAVFIKNKMESVTALLNTIVRLGEHSVKLQKHCSEIIEILVPELKEWEYDFNAGRKKILLKRKKVIL